MIVIKNLFVGAVGLFHLYFMVLEMFYWTKPLGLRTFRMSIEKARESAVLAANQGLYNGFLSVGLFWSILHPNPDFSKQLSVFFLCCVVLAGLYGAYSVNRRILWVQALPALLALVTVYCA